jgi:hypothetical protein
LIKRQYRSLLGDDLFVGGGGGGKLNLGPSLLNQSFIVRPGYICDNQESDSQLRYQGKERVFRQKSAIHK